MSPTWQPQGVVIQQAIEWHQRLDQGEMDPASQREFRAWMRSPAHAKELARICLIDALLHHDPSLKREKSKKRPALPENVLHFQSYAPSPPAYVSQPPVARAAPSLAAKIAIAAGVVLAMPVVAVVGLVRRLSPKG